MTMHTSYAPVTTTSVVVPCFFIPSCYSPPITPRFVLFFVAVPGCCCFHLNLLPDLPTCGSSCVFVGKYERGPEPAIR